VRMLKLFFAVIFTGWVLLLFLSGCATKTESVVEEPTAVEQEAEVQEEAKPEATEEAKPEVTEEKKVEKLAEPVVVDSDSDGIPDDRDKCPDTPAGVAVDAQGCPAPAQEEFTIQFTLEFDIDSARIRTVYFEQREKAVELMSENPRAVLEQVIIEGYSDSTGTEKHNYKLSKKRAENVKQYLISELGIDPEIIGMRAFGERYPIASNRTKAGRQKNRRVLITFSVKQ